MATPPDFTAGQVLTAAQMNAVGLWLVKTQTIGSAVNTVTVTDAFTADFNAYKIIISDGVASTQNVFRFQLGASTTGYYMGRSGVAYASGTASVGADNNAALWTNTGTGNSSGLSMNIELVNPNLAKWTYISGAYSPNDTGVSISGVHQVATAYTAFTLTPNTGTWTGGTIRIYGYRL